MKQFVTVMNHIHTIQLDLVFFIDVRWGYWCLSSITTLPEISDDVKVKCVCHFRMYRGPKLNGSNSISLDTSNRAY